MAEAEMFSSFRGAHLGQGAPSQPLTQIIMAKFVTLTTETHEMHVNLDHVTSFGKEGDYFYLNLSDRSETIQINKKDFEDLEMESRRDEGSRVVSALHSIYELLRARLR